MYGLRLSLFIDQNNYSELSTDAGVQVVVHDVTQMPFPDEDGVSVPPGLSAFVGIKLVSVTNMPYLLSCS